MREVTKEVLTGGPIPDHRVLETDGECRELMHEIPLPWVWFRKISEKDIIVPCNEALRAFARPDRWSMSSGPAKEMRSL